MEKKAFVQGVLRYLFWVISTAVSLLLIFVAREFYLVLAEFLGFGPRVIDVIDKIALLVVGFFAVAGFVTFLYYYAEQPVKKFLYVSCLQISLTTLLFFLRSLLVSIYLKSFTFLEVLILFGLLALTIVSYLGGRRVQKVFNG